MIMKKITIIGAGLTGSLLAILLGNRGHEITIYERNPDTRKIPLKSGKSINLTLCKRGLNALEKSGLGAEIHNLSSRAYGRFLHLEGSKSEIQLYGNHNESLYSISRHALNCLLISAAEKTPGVKIQFNAKYLEYDINSSTICIENDKQSISHIPFDLLIAADGVYSKVRQQMQKYQGFNYSQYYSKHSNKELKISADKAIQYNLSQNYLHIWPRNECMLIGFPNPDKSFTCHLQMPIKDHEISFNAIDSEEKLFSVFNELFPDAVPLISNLAEDFFNNPQIPMLTVRCSPWNVSDKILLIGDAAHGIWPSYGQGVNAGFEDCIELDECLNKNSNTLDAFNEFQKRRKNNSDIIADLSENHGKEIRELVADSDFLFRKKLERKINSLYPDEYFSLYSRIAFTDISYENAVKMESQYRYIIDELLSNPEIKNEMNSAQSLKKIHEKIILLKK